MPTVPRGTSTEPAVIPMLFRKEMRLAIETGAKTVTRRILAAGNCIVQPGTFDGLDLDSGRVRTETLPLAVRQYLRARCDFGKGRVRVVSVLPKIEPGDLCYVKSNRYTSRAKSALTLRVSSVGLSRLQDMTDAQAEAEGVSVLDMPTLRPREAFIRLWDRINGAGAWDRNPWVWAYEFEAIKRNVDEWLER